MNRVVAKKILFTLLVSVLAVVPVLPAMAGNPFGENSLLTNTCAGAGYNCNPGGEEGEFFAATLGTVVLALLSLIGILFIILMMYGGYTWMTARGNEEQVSKGKHIIQQAIIGLVVIFASYAIWAAIEQFLL